MRPVLLAATTALLLSPARGLHAQTIPSPYRFIETRQEAGLFGGWIDPGTGRFGYGPGAGPMVGVRYGIVLSGPLAMAGVVSWTPTTRDVVHPGREEGDRVIGEADANLLGADLRLELGLTGDRTWHGVQPFAAAGVGLAWDLAGTAAIEEELEEPDRFELGTALVATLGGGLRWFLTDRVVVRADGLLHLWRLDAPEGFRLEERGFGDVGESEWVSATSLTLGLGYRF